MTVASFTPQLVPLGPRHMTRFCIQCNQIIGEKCVRCGAEAIGVPNGRAVTGGDFDCPCCAHRFAQGDGGKTGGMCDACNFAAGYGLSKRGTASSSPFCIFGRSKRLIAVRCRRSRSFRLTLWNLSFFALPIVSSSSPTTAFYLPG
jgi:hypothetical protein